MAGGAANDAVGSRAGQPVAPVATPAPQPTVVTKDGRKVRVVKKGAEAAKPSPVLKPAAQAAAPEETFDNYPDFVDWALNKVGAPAPVAQAYKMKGGSTEDSAEGIGEYAGQTHSTRAIGKELGVSGQTVSNWVKELSPKLKELELMHLVAKKADSKVAAPELVADLAPANEEGDAAIAEAPEDTTRGLAEEADAGGAAITRPRRGPSRFLDGLVEAPQRPRGGPARQRRGPASALSQTCRVCGRGLTSLNHT